MAMDENFVILSLSGMLSFSKRTSHREQSIAIISSLIRFFQENGLTKRAIADMDEQLPHDVEIRKSDLTDEGFEFYRIAESKWLAAIDRGKSPMDTKILERELAKMRSE